MIKYWIHGGGGKYYESGIQYSCLSLFRGEREKKKKELTRVFTDLAHLNLTRVVFEQ